MLHTFILLKGGSTFEFLKLNFRGEVSYASELDLDKLHKVLITEVFYLLQEKYEIIVPNILSSNILITLCKSMCRLTKMIFFIFCLNFYII